MRLRESNIDEIFGALNAQIGVHKEVPINLIVCGGTALAALGLVSRTTKDADVLGFIEMKHGIPHILGIKKLPQWLVHAADIVARDFGLPPHWLNTGPSGQVESGLPEGFVERLVSKRYGEFLTISYISRIDQIHFKLYAGVDRDDYHVQDLLALKPTVSEIESATRWVLTQDVSEPFRLVLKDFLNKTGYGQVAQSI